MPDCLSHNLAIGDLVTITDDATGAELWSGRRLGMIAEGHGRRVLAIVSDSGAVRVYSERPDGGRQWALSGVVDVDFGARVAAAVLTVADLRIPVAVAEAAMALTVIAQQAVANLAASGICEKNGKNAS